MAKYFGKIAFARTFETSPGVWTEEMEIREYYGDVIRNARRLVTPSDSLNDNVEISNEFSIVGDAIAYNDFHSMRWIEWMGTKWKINSVSVEHPRLILSVGGVYHDQ